MFVCTLSWLVRYVLNKAAFLPTLNPVQRSPQMRTCFFVSGITPQCVSCADRGQAGCNDRKGILKRMCRSLIRLHELYRSAVNVNYLSYS